MTNEEEDKTTMLTGLAAQSVAPPVPTVLTAALEVFDKINAIGGRLTDDRILRVVGIIQDPSEDIQERRKALPQSWVPPKEEGGKPTSVTLGRMPYWGGDEHNAVQELDQELALLSQARQTCESGETKRAIMALYRACDTGPRISVAPPVIIALLDELERYFIENYVEGYTFDEVLRDVPIKTEPVRAFAETMAEEASKCQWMEGPLVFLYDQGVLLHDIETVLRHAGRLNPGQGSKIRVVLGHALSEVDAIELGGDVINNRSDGLMVGIDKHWVETPPTLTPLLLWVLYALSYAKELTLLDTHKKMTKGRLRRQPRYRLDITPEEAVAFFHEHMQESQPMRKGTVFDNIPCLELDFSSDGPLVRITCRKCKENEEAKIRKVGIAPHVFLKQWARNGWQIQGDGRKALCPKCIAAKKKAKEPEVVMAQPAPPQRVEVVPPKPLHQRQNAARMVLGRTNLGVQARSEAEQRCRDLGISEVDIIRISLKAQGRNVDGTDMEEVDSAGKRRNFSRDFKDEFVRRALRLPADARRRLLDANDIHPGMFRRWKQELYAAEHDEPDEDDEPDITEDLIDNMIDQGVDMAQRVEAKLESGDDFSDDLKLEVVTVCSDMDEQERADYLYSLDVTEAMYQEWKQLLEPEETDEAAITHVNGRAVVVPASVSQAANEPRAPSPMPPDVPSLDPQLMFTLFGLFERGIDKKRKRYQKGWDDERVAREAEVDVALVVRVREQTIGKIVDEAYIQRVEQRITEREAKYQKDLAAIREMMVDLETKYDEDLKTLRAEIGR